MMKMVNLIIMNGGQVHGEGVITRKKRAPSCFVSVFLRQIAIFHDGKARGVYPMDRDKVLTMTYTRYTAIKC